LGFTQDQIKKILDAVRYRTSRPAITCSVCNNREWTLTDGFVLLPVTTTDTVSVVGSTTIPADVETVVAGSPVTMPCVALVCNKCGHVLLLNVFFLELQELLPKPLKDAFG
jgi:hypothetical protein